MLQRMKGMLGRKPAGEISSTGSQLCDCGAMFADYGCAWILMDCGQGNEEICHPSIRCGCDDDARIQKDLDD